MKVKLKLIETVENTVRVALQGKGKSRKSANVSSAAQNNRIKTVLLKCVITCFAISIYSISACHGDSLVSLKALNMLDFDYKGINVSGKIVSQCSGTPPDDHLVITTAFYANTHILKSQHV